jgi:hypothetical protein
MNPFNPTASTIPCPKCATALVLAAITPHPIATQMQRYTFLCSVCNQTKTYMLPATTLAAAQAAEPIKDSA